MTDLVTYEQLVKEVQLPDISDEASATKAQNLMKIRRYLIERIAGIRVCQANIFRHKSTLVRVQEQILSEDREYVFLDLQGRGMEAEAKMVENQMTIEQLWLELAMYRAMLIEGDK